MVTQRYKQIEYGLDKFQYESNMAQHEHEHEHKHKHDVQSLEYMNEVLIYRDNTMKQRAHEVYGGNFVHALAS